MTAFDSFKRMFAEDDTDITAGQRFISGGMAGVVTHAALFPLEGTLSSSSFVLLWSHPHFVDQLSKFD